MTKLHEKRAATTPMVNRPHISNRPRFNAANVDYWQGVVQPFAALPHRVVGFDILKHQGCRNAALSLHTWWRFFVCALGYQLVAGCCMGLYAAGSLGVQYVNLQHLAAFSRLTSGKVSNHQGAN